MANPFESESADYLVIVNHEEMYSIWPAFREIPEGWKVTGPKGGRQLCVGWIEANWTDMRPRKLRSTRAREIGSA